MSKLTIKSSGIEEFPLVLQEGNPSPVFQCMEPLATLIANRFNSYENPFLNREDLGEKLARAMEPDCWRDYDAGNGKVANETGWKIIDTIHYAGRVMDILETLGYPMEKKEKKNEDNS